MADSYNFQVKWTSNETKKSISNEREGCLAMLNVSQMKPENIHNKFIITFDSLRCKTVHTFQRRVSSVKCLLPVLVLNYREIFIKQTNTNEMKRRKMEYTCLELKSNTLLHESFTTSERTYTSIYYSPLLVSFAINRSCLLSRWWRWRRCLFCVGAKLSSLYNGLNMFCCYVYVSNKVWLRWYVNGDTVRMLTM